MKSHQSSHKRAEALPLSQKHGSIAKTKVAFAKLRCDEEAPYIKCQSKPSRDSTDEWYMPSIPSNPNAINGQNIRDPNIAARK